MYSQASNLSSVMRTEVTVQATVNGDTQTIGSIAATLMTSTIGFPEAGTFTFNSEFSILDAKYDFRWVQIVSTDSSPPVVLRDGMFQPLITPYIDPPPGGYAHQASSGGADDEPFYENTGPGDYFYPTFDLRHVEGFKSWTDDIPDLRMTGFVTFRTFLVLSGATLWNAIGEDTFDVLAGYEWTIGRNSTGSRLLGGIHPRSINSKALDEINLAMDQTGFLDWLAVTGTELGYAMIPEPSAYRFVVWGIGLLVFVRRKRSSTRS